MRKERVPWLRWKIEIQDERGSFQKIVKVKISLVQIMDLDFFQNIFQSFQTKLIVFLSMLIQVLLKREM